MINEEQIKNKFEIGTNKETNTRENNKEESETETEDNLNMSGGVKIKKVKDDTNTIQQIINKKLMEMIDMKAFVKKQTSMMQPNTYGITCPYCKVKDNIYAETVQTRSSDEASDRILKCLHCGAVWKSSGSHG